MVKKCKKTKNISVSVILAAPIAKKRYLTGFTLIELLVVCAILAILATVVIINLMGAKNKSRYGRVISDMTAIATAVKAYGVSNNNIYPGDGTYDTLPPPFSSYLPTWPATPCGSEYGYEYNNWNANGSMNSPGSIIPGNPNGFIAIHFRHRVAGGDDSWVYYYNIRNFDDPGVVAGGGKSKGSNIFSVSSKEITCNEHN